MPKIHFTFLLRIAVTGIGVALGAGTGVSAGAARTDRTQPWVLEADRPSTFDLQRQVTVLNGNVVISQGTMVLRAERVEMRELPDGYRAASAIGLPGKPATWRQRREGGDDEIVEGTANRIDFDGRTDTLRFVGNSAVRRLRSGAVADEINGATIVWDNAAEIFRVEGGAATLANPSGRVRVTLTPRATNGAAGRPAATAVVPGPGQAASAGSGSESGVEAGADARAAAGAAALSPSGRLGDKR